MSLRFILTTVLAALLAACGQGAQVRPPDIAAAPDVGWTHYGGDPGGLRYSPANQVNLANVDRLKPAWTYSTGEMKAHPRAIRRSAFQATPILADGRLYLCTPFNRVIALDPATGQHLWTFDPQLDDQKRYPNDFVCRGVAFWRDPMAPTRATCASRIFTATNDRRLFALDAATGQVCPGFGRNGAVDAMPGAKLQSLDDAQITSAPVVAEGVVIVGSSIDDNQRVRETAGSVHGFDARTGALKWIYDPLQAAGQGITAGAANVWAPMSVDEARGLVFLPTSSPSPDFYGAARRGANAHANSVVALRAGTGQVAWAFQTTHHDVWDYDVPAQPTLAEVSWKGQPRPAVIQVTKQGLVFTLDRETGRPVIPVEERPVPQGGEVGEVLSPTQPFPVAPAPLAPNRIRPEDAFGITKGERESCRKAIASARNEGLYTPPSLGGAIVHPFTGGGANWGGMAYDPKVGVAFVNTSSLVHLVTLIPRERLEAERRANPDVEISPQAGAPFGMRREVLRSPLGVPCNPPPWGRLSAVEMSTGKIIWSTPLGTTRDLAPGSQWLLKGVGTPNVGGPIVTGSGLVFIGAAMDNYLRAFDSRTGREVWKGRLPAGGQATPMTYVWKGRQYVVISAGGHAKSGTRLGDQVVAFALR
jgi:quinoprotein glucose dehydrogenase